MVPSLQPSRGFYDALGNLACSRTHIWGRSTLDRRQWLVMPTTPGVPAYHAVIDDHGELRAADGGLL